MKHLAIALVLAFPLADAASACGKPAAHKVSAVPQPSVDASCPNVSRFLLHAAYIPVAADRTLRCGHFLGTDAVMTVHRWDRT
jgi:hypothetical protein